MLAAVVLLWSITEVVSLRLPRCTIAVAGANGRVGSMVCRELLRNHPQVTVRALVRSVADPFNGYGRLSYEVGVEDAKMDIEPAWTLGGAKISGEFDEEVQGDYGLNRLALSGCELCYEPDVEEALADVDAVVYCASAFDSRRQRTVLDESISDIANFGKNLFELRFGRLLSGENARNDGSDSARKEAARGKTADVEGLQNVIDCITKKRRREDSLAQLTGVLGARSQMKNMPALVVVSAARQVSNDQGSSTADVPKNDFGLLKQRGEIAVKKSELPSVIVRSAALDDLRGEEGLEVKLITDPDKVSAQVQQQDKTDMDPRNRRIHPRDLAKYLVRCLSDETLRTNSELDQTDEARVASSAEMARTVEVWSYLEQGLFGGK